MTHPILSVNIPYNQQKRNLYSRIGTFLSELEIFI